MGASYCTRDNRVSLYGKVISMKQTSNGMWVKHFGRVGVVEAANSGHAIVRFPSSDGFPFPTQTVVKVTDLKRYKKAAPVADSYEAAPF